MNVTDEQIIATLCDECGYDLVGFSRAADSITVSAIDREGGGLRMLGIATGFSQLALGDITLDRLRAMLMGELE